MNEESDRNQVRFLIPPKPPSNLMWAAICILAIATAGGGWYLHREMSRQAQVQPSSNQSVASVEGLKTQLSAQQADLRDWSHHAMDLDKRMDTVEGRLKSGRVLTHRQAERILKPVEARMNVRLDQSITAKTAMLESRFAQMDAAEQSVRIQLAHLENQQATASKKLAALGFNSQWELGALRQQEQRMAHRAVMTPATSKKQVHFEARRNNMDKVEPGIELTVLSTDPEKQQYSGYMQLLEDRTVVWIKNQDIQVPLVIQPKAGGPALELVVNRVASGDVTGYLELPASDAAYAKAADVVADWASAHANGAMR